MPTHRQQDKLIILMHLYEVSDKSAIRRCAIRVNENLGTRRRLTKEPRRHLHMKARWIIKRKLMPNSSKRRDALHDKTLRRCS